jgi:hypothetical protein
LHSAQCTVTKSASSATALHACITAIIHLKTLV